MAIDVISVYDVVVDLLFHDESADREDLLGGDYNASAPDAILIIFKIIQDELFLIFSRLVLADEARQDCGNLKAI